MGEPKYNLKPLVETLKSIGIVVGSLGSFAAVFFWIGNIIIIARLRAYNLYGIVHYTDEYVKEAGYQFLQDVFTNFFQVWYLIPIFILATILVIVLIPVGPFSCGDKPEKVRSPKSIQKWIRYYGCHYYFFIALALTASMPLTFRRPSKILYNNIMSKIDLLEELDDMVKIKDIAFILKDKEPSNAIQRRFYERITVGQEPTEEWLRQFLYKLYPEKPEDEGSAAEKLSNRIKRFQKDFKIKEQDTFKFNGDFKKSQTYRISLSISLIDKLNKKLQDSVGPTLREIRYLRGRLDDKEDFTSYGLTNNSIRKTIELHENLKYFFTPTNEESRIFMSKLSEIKPIRSFGSKHNLLSYSFWVLVVILFYLLANIPRVLNLKLLEIGYFLLMLLLFILIAIKLPTAYGRYKFEFNIHKLNDIAFSEDDIKQPIKEKINNFLKDEEASLYILGPTRGKEVILGVIRTERSSAIFSPQILLLDRDSCKFMHVEPVSAEDMEIINYMLLQRR